MQQITSSFKAFESVGQLGERLALTFLTKHGLNLISRNWRIPGGEIDLIMTENRKDGGHEMVFVEVKTRKSLYFGAPEDSLVFYKKRALIRTILHYMLRNDIKLGWRLDLVCVLLSSPHRAFIKHYRNILEE